MMKAIYKNSLILLCTLFMFHCSDPLDKRDLSSFLEEDVFNDPTLATGFINVILRTTMDPWPTVEAGFSDDAVGQFGFMYGEPDSDDIDEFEDLYKDVYAIIFDINFFIERIDQGGLESTLKEQLKAQAYFYRAMNYFNLVSLYGGVPLVLQTGAPEDGDALNLPRSGAEECFNQIVADLDLAIAGLPEEWGGDDYGRITKGAAMAYKGRILNHWASEQFDPNQTARRWSAALAANQAALTNLQSNGKALNADFADIWTDETDGNSEAIIVRKYNTELSSNRNAGCRPFIVGTNGESFNKATIDLINAFPMRDGKAIDDLSSSYTYDPVAFWLNRDPRFSASIAYNGVVWPLNDPQPNRTSDLQWSFLESAIEQQANDGISPTSFYCRKAVDGTTTGGAAALIGTTDWIEMRYAEVLLNVAEAANEAGGNDNLVYDILTQLRERAGIDAGSDGLYGLQAGMDQDGLRDAILLERRIELFSEGKRSADLRRRRMYDQLNGSHRMGYVIRRTAAFDALNPSEEILDDRITLENGIIGGTINLDDPNEYQTYFETITRSVERMSTEVDLGDAINYPDYYYFWKLPQSAIDRNPMLEQTQGWPGGTFDPLQ